VLISERSGIAIAAISTAAAKACGEGCMSVEAAVEPTDSALLALAARLCDSRGA
jgi:uroporphyrinogen-III synthase